MEIGYCLASEEHPPKVLVAARLAGSKGDGSMSTSLAPSEAAALKVAKERAPNAAVSGSPSTELPLPRDFDSVSALVREEDLESALVLGDDPAMWRERIDELERAGFTHVCLHNVSGEQQELVELAKQFV
ncbi:MAG: hypothetical protein ACRDM1_08670 [Gaiellaceae bacterium]